MKKHQLAVQLYTLRNFLQTPEDIARSLAKVKAIGYDTIQVSGMGEIEESRLTQFLGGPTTSMLRIVAVSLQATRSTSIARELFSL